MLAQAERRQRELEDLAVARFGLTADPLRAGFVLRDGRLLDFAKGTRYALDHTEAAKLGDLLARVRPGAESELYAHVLALDAFMAESGAVRVDLGKSVVEAKGPVTPAQARALVRGAGLTDTGVVVLERPTDRTDRGFEWLRFSVRPDPRAQRLTVDGVLGFFGAHGATPVEGGRTLFHRRRNQGFHGARVKQLAGGRFRLDFIGTGEGAQTFGYGLYFASLRDVAEFYRTSLSGAALEWATDEAGAGGELILRAREAGISGDLLLRVAGNYTSTSKTVSDAVRKLRRDGAEHAQYALAAEALERGLIRPSGQVFKVELPGDEALLVLDGPLMDQEPEVIAAVMRVDGGRFAHLGRAIELNRELSALSAQPAVPRDSPENAARNRLHDRLRAELTAMPDAGAIAYRTGSWLYDWLNAGLGTERAASLHLLAHGIRGAKYRDQQSRGGPGDRATHNFVVWDEEAIRVLETYYQARAANAPSVSSPHAYPPQSEPRSPVRLTAHGIKAGVPEAIARAAEEMAADVPPGAVLVPIPASGGRATATLALAEAIAARVEGARVADVLRAPARESSYARQARGLARLTAEEIGTRMEGERLPGGPVVLVDNVVASGETVRAARRALGFEAPIVAYAVTAPARRALRAGPPEDPRGSITFDTAMREALVVFRTKADASTVIHELGHYFTLWLLQRAQEPDADEGTKRDAEALLRFVGIDQPDLFTGRLSDEGAEKLAEAFVVYLRTGRAPSRELRGAFASFRQWLRDLYETVRELIGEDALPEDVRQVFDRLLATDAEIAQVRQDELGGSIFSAADVSPAERAAIEEAMRLSAAEVRSELDRLQLRELARRRGIFEKVAAERRRLAAAERAEIRAQVEAEVNADKAWQADHYLRTGHFLGAKTPPGTPAAKLSRAAMLELFGGPETEAGKAILAVPTGARSWLSATAGVHPDEVAEQLGYDTGADLVRALLAIGSREAGSRERRIEEITDERLRAAESLPPGELERAALRALRSDARAEFLRLEDEVLSGRTGNPVAEDLAARARAIIAEREVRNLRPDLHRAVARKSRREALLAVRRADWTRAQVYHRRGMLHELLEAEARAAQERTEKIVAKARRYERSPKVRKEIGLAGHGYLDQLDGVLEMVELRVLPMVRARARQVAFLEWIDERLNAGDEILVPEWVRERGQRHWRTLTVTELEGLGAVLDSIAHAAREQRTMKLGDELVERETVRDGLIAELVPLRQATRSDALTATRFSLRGVFEALVHRDGEKLGDLFWAGFRRMDAALAGKEAFVAGLVGFDVTSWSHRALIRPFVDAYVQHADFMTRVVVPVRELVDRFIREHGRSYDAHLPEERLTWTKADGSVVPMKVSHRDLLGIGLNVGNRGQLEKLMGGFGWWDGQDETFDAAAARVMEVLDEHLTDEDWRLVQAVWDLLDEQWPAIAEHEKRLSGVAPERVEPLTFSTATGRRMRGGYFPVVYDPERSIRTAMREAAEVLRLRPEGFGKVETPHPFTKARTKLRSRAMKIDAFGVLLNHLEDVSLDLAFRAPLLSTYKLLNDERLNAHLREQLGHEFTLTEFWLPWLQAMAGDVSNVGGVRGLEKLARGGRARAASFVMLARASTVLVQATGLSNAWQGLAELVEGHRVGAGVRHAVAAKYLVDGIWQAIGRGSWPEAQRTARVALAESGVLRHRIEAFDRELKEIAREVAGRYGWPQRTKRTFQHFIAGAQLYLVDMPLYHAARRLARDQGKSEADSIATAESVLKITQGSGNLEAQAALIAHGGPFADVFTFLGTYVGAQWNTVRASWRRHHSVPATTAALLVAVIQPLVAGFLIREVLKTATAALSGAEPPSDEDRLARLGEEILGGLAGLLPGLRDFWRTLLLGEDPEAPGWIGVWGDVAQAVQRGVEGAAREDEWGRALIAFAELALLSQGMPGEWPLEEADRALRDAEREELERGRSRAGRAGRAGRSGR